MGGGFHHLYPSKSEQRLIHLDVMVSKEVNQVPTPKSSHHDYTYRTKYKLVFRILTLRFLLTQFCLLGDPVPVLSWYRDQALIDDTYEVINNETTNILVIPKIQRKDLNSIFTCQAVSPQLDIPVSTQLRLDLTCKFFPHIPFLYCYENCRQRRLLP